MAYPAELIEILPEDAYEEVRLAGKGGFGSVYRAVDRRTHQSVALKLLRVGEPESAARIKREIGVMQDLAGSAHIAGLRAAHFSPSGTSALMVYEWIQGPTLETVVQQQSKPLPFEKWTAVAAQFCDGLRHLHGSNILHRDVKPANILLGVDGLVRLTDFGLAIIKTSKALITAEGTFIGTLRYSPPETIMGARPTAAADVYSAGMSILFMVLGRNPLPDAELPELINQIITGAAAAEVPKIGLNGLDIILKTMLAVNPAERPSIATVVDAIRARRLPEPNEPESIRQLIGKEGAPPEAPRSPSILVNLPAPIPNPETVPDLLRSLSDQVHQVQAVVTDMTARFSVASLKPKDKGVPEIELAIKRTFEQLSQRLSTTWKTSLIMTIVLFSLFVVMVILAVIMGLIYKQSTLSLIFGAGSAASVFTVILWRPIDKMLLITVATQQLELIKINFQRALTGSKNEQRQAFKEVSAQLESLLGRVMDAGSNLPRRRAKAS